ncbi:DEAD/DEAH box helicase family protein [Ralstonia phage RP13]|nr:DEAD/DEAH box helicase family protein [Ralstonia phage RP13]
MLTLSRLPGFKVRISSDDPSILDNVKKYLTIRYMDQVYQPWRKVNKWVTQEVVHTFFWENKDSTLDITRSMASVLIKWLDSTEVPYTYENQLPFVKIELIDKWRNIFATHPKPEKGKLQLKAFEALTEEWNGIASLYTGLGKSELLLSAAESYMAQHDGNAVIVVYSSKVGEELESRARQYNVELGGRLRIINPVGFYRSNFSKTDEAKKWLSEVGLIVADEAHHFSSLVGKWAQLVYDCDPDYIWGFSATSDVADGSEIDINTPTKTKSVQVMSLISFCGVMSINEDLPVPVNIIRVNTEITSKADYDQYKIDNPTRMQFLISLFLTNPKTPRLIKHLIDRFVPKDSLIFIPELTGIETGEFLANSLNALGVPTVYFSGSSVITPIGPVDLLTIDDLKGLARDRHFKVLISNAVGVEGIDIPNLAAVMPLTGASYKNIMQSAGRSARADEFVCIFVWDKHNNQLNRQQTDKYKTVKQRMVVKSNIGVTVDPYLI